MNEAQSVASSVLRLGVHRWLVALWLLVGAWPCLAQEPRAGLDPVLVQRLKDAEQRAAEALAKLEGAASEEPAPIEPPPPDAAQREMNLLELAVAGGPLMIPIVGLSIIVVMFAVERANALGRSRVIPPQLVEALGLLGLRRDGFDPRLAYRACKQHPSPAATVVRAAMLRVGRPYAEIERTVGEARERVAADMYRHVRPIELAVGIAPLLGLLGTVQGMIMAFFQTAASTPGADKASELATGIYVALVTTFAGLCVAIPAAILAHLFEGRIQSLVRDIDEVLLGIMPQLERFEGKIRVGRRAAVKTVDDDAMRPKKVAKPSAMSDE